MLYSIGLGPNTPRFDKQENNKAVRNKKKKTKKTSLDMTSSSPRGDGFMAHGLLLAGAAPSGSARGRSARAEGHLWSQPALHLGHCRRTSERLARKGRGPDEATARRRNVLLDWD